MKSLITFICLHLVISVANASPKLSCVLVDDFDDWSVEVKANKAAFFDNDSWALADLSLSYEIYPAIDIYKSQNPEDQFEISVQIFPMPSKKINASITLDYDGKNQTFELKCKRVAKLLYLDDLVE